MLWTSGSWSASYSESMLISDKTTISSFYTYGSPSYLYFASFSVSDGSVISSRYKSTISLSYVWGATISGDYLVTIACTSDFLGTCYLVLLNKVSSQSSMRLFNGKDLFGCTIESSSGR